MRIDDTTIIAGEMREQIQIQLDTIGSQNSYGEPVATWATITGGTVWAEARPLRGAETMVAQQVSDDLSFVFILRYLAGITPKNRVLYRSRYFDINAVLNVNERRIKTVLLCQEVT